MAGEGIYGSRRAFFSSQFEQRLHRWLRWRELDDVDGLPRRPEREPGVDRCGSADDDDSATGPASPDGGGHDHVHAARVNERQLPEVEHHQPGVTLSPA
jgi:hypothetical protein